MLRSFPRCILGALLGLLLLTGCDGDGGTGTEPPGDTNTLTVRSSNPDDGVAITVSPADTDGAGNGVTPFSRTYAEGTDVTLTAPSDSPDGTTFVRWEQGSTTVSTEAEASVSLSQNRTLTAVYDAPDQQFGLTVTSEAPDSGVDIDISPVDANGEGGGATPFDRVYDAGTDVTLTAPETTTDDRVFVRWVLDEENQDRNARELTVPMTAERAARAVYEAPAPLYTLTIASEAPDAGVSIMVNPEDQNGATDGTTSFERQYRAGAEVTLTAPEEASGNVFDRWRLDGSDSTEGERVLTFAMDSNRIATARYVTPEEAAEPSATLVDTSYAVGGRPSGLPEYQMQRELGVLALSSSILDTGHIGLFHLRDGGVEALPDSYLIDLSDDGTPDTEVTFSFNAVLGEVLLDLTATDQGVFLHPSWLPDRVLIVLITEDNLPGAFGEDVDLSDYSAVAEFYGLPPNP
ncbi:MAG: hypothetical protein GVY12_14785 [Bacteroidetes bacterium]|jgi:hypothetical protein|nr:hypothetical protein [Bacteroidota bacterium]